MDYQRNLQENRAIREAMKFYFGDSEEDQDIETRVRKLRGLSFPQEFEHLRNHERSYIISRS